MAGLNLFTNNAATTLASSILVGATSLTVAASTGGLFPNPTSGQYFYCTLQNTTGTVIEIVKVTARSTDTFTIVRAQDNTTASAFAAGDKVELRATAADLNNFGQLDSTNTWALAQTFTSPIAATSGGTGTGTYTTGDIIYASGTNTLSKLSIGTTGQALTVSGGVPAWAAAGGSTSLTTTSFTATAGQTSFTVSYTPSLVQGVYRNGVKLDPADYTASSGTAIVLAAAAALNDNIQVQFFTALSTLATPLAVSLGGTGQSSNLTQYGLMYGSTTTAMATTAAGTSTQVLHGNAAGAPTWSAVSLTADVTGTLPVANGGTGVASATAYALLAGGTTSTGAFQSLASVGTTGQILTSNGAGALPTFQAAAGGGGLGGMTVYSFRGTASKATTVLTVSAVSNGLINVGDTITTTAGTSLGVVSSFGTGTGGVGTYNMSTSSTQTSTTVYTSAGTFTIPTGKTVVKVTVVAGGGGGGGTNGLSSFGGGGGGSAITYLTGLTPGNTLTVTRGTGGAGGASGGGGNGSTGGTSSVSSGTQTITTVSATGGNGGVAPPPGTYTYGAGTTGGSGSGASFVLTGGGSGPAIQLYEDKGCGNAVFVAGSNGGSSLFGGTASGYVNLNAGPLGTAAVAYGAGGTGGGLSATGIAGFAGIVIFEY